MNHKPRQRVVRSQLPGVPFARRRTTMPLLLLMLGGLVESCALFSPPPIPPALDVTGFWEGRSEGLCVARVPGCGSVVLISLSMIQNEANITGVYRCANGNTTCRNLNFHGQIAVGTIRGPGVSLRIMFEDVSSCIFNGTFSDAAGAGAYVCMQGAGIVERGLWQVRRAYGPPPASTE